MVFLVVSLLDELYAGKHSFLLSGKHFSVTFFFFLCISVIEAHLVL